MQCNDSLQSVSLNNPSDAAGKYRLGDLLLEDHVISEGQLDSAVRYQQDHREMALGDILVDQHLISPRQLKRCLKRQKSLRTAMFSIAFCILPAQMVAAKGLEQQSHSSWDQPVVSQFHSMAVSDNVAQQLEQSQAVVYSISGPLTLFDSKPDSALADTDAQAEQEFEEPSAKYRFNVLKDGISFNVHYKF